MTGAGWVASPEVMVLHRTNATKLQRQTRDNALKRVNSGQTAAVRSHIWWDDVATPEGIEPSTCRLEVGCSIQLSYGAGTTCAA